MKNYSAVGCRRVDVLTDRSKTSTRNFDLLNNINEVTKRPGEPVVLRHDNHIIFTEMLKHLLKLRSLSRLAGDLLLEDLLSAGTLERIDLRLKVLIGRRNPGVS